MYTGGTIWTLTHALTRLVPGLVVANECLSHRAPRIVSRDVLQPLFPKLACAVVALFQRQMPFYASVSPGDICFFLFATVSLCSGEHDVLHEEAEISHEGEDGQGDREWAANFFDGPEEGSEFAAPRSSG